MSQVPPGLAADIQRCMAALVLDVLSCIHLREGQMEYALRCLNEGLSLRKVRQEVGHEEVGAGAGEVSRESGRMFVRQRQGRFRV